MIIWKMLLYLLDEGAKCNLMSRPNNRAGAGTTHTRSTFAFEMFPFFSCIKTKQIKRFCYLIKWHGVTIATTTTTTGVFAAEAHSTSLLVRFISPSRNCLQYTENHANANATNDCNLHFCCLFSRRQKLFLHHQLVLLGFRGKKKKEQSWVICSVFCRLQRQQQQYVDVINPRQSFSLTIVSSLLACHRKQMDRICFGNVSTLVGWLSQRFKGQRTHYMSACM